MSYLDFLKHLIALGPKFPQLLVILQEIVEKFQEAVSIITGQPLTFKGTDTASLKVSAEEIDKERQLTNIEVQAGETHGAIGDGMILRQLWAFLRENPELLTFVLSLLKKSS